MSGWPMFDAKCCEGERESALEIRQVLAICTGLTTVVRSPATPGCALANTPAANDLTSMLATTPCRGLSPSR